LWIILMSTVHIIIYLSLLIPIAIVLYIIDAIIYPTIHIISWLIHFIKLKL
jgi:hypothetical protein